jgi:hypothetical protein
MRLGDRIPSQKNEKRLIFAKNACQNHINFSTDLYTYGNSSACKKNTKHCIAGGNREGGEDSTGFKKKEWLSILTSFNSSTGLKYNRQQRRSQLSILKAAYTSFKKVSDNSEFGWDEDLKIPTAPDSVWEILGRPSRSCKISQRDLALL